MTISLAHGSTATPDDPINFEFKLFDYLRVHDKPVDPRINNGNDGDGPGVYTIAGEGAWKFAERYAGTNGEGAVFAMTLELDELATDLSADTIEPEMWAAVVERFVTLRNYDAGFDPVSLEQFIGDSVDEILNSEPHDFIAKHKETLIGYMGDALSESDFSYVLEEIIDNGGDWEPPLEEHVGICQPNSYILDEGTPYEIGEYAIERSENLWEAMMYVWRICAVTRTGKGEYSYNDTFYQAMKHVVPDDIFPKAALVDDVVYVVFDVDALTIQAASVRTFDQETKDISAKISTLLDGMRSTLDDYPVDAGAKAVKAAVDKNFNIVLDDKTATLLSMNKSDPNYQIKIIREAIGTINVNEVERRLGVLDELRGVEPLQANVSDEPSLGMGGLKR